jgi:hypothetical protein
MLAILLRKCRAFLAQREPPEKRGRRLLLENLTPHQRQQYQQYRYFDVIGGSSGRRYRIRFGTSMNIDELDAEGRQVGRWCFFPKGGLVIGDVMLAQKLALELFEEDALVIAHQIP